MTPAAGLERRHFFDESQDTLRIHCQEHGRQGFLADQVLDWVYAKAISQPAEMTNLSNLNRAWLADTFVFEQSQILKHQLATDGTQKLLLGWQDAMSREMLPVLGSRTLPETECVMIPADDRRTACISSQVGCPVGCRFCASGIGGLESNLSAGRIVEQVHRLRLLAGVGRISHVVFMGMGEPLANYAAVTQAIRSLHAPWGFGISARKITVSTVGLPAAIRRFATFELPVTLALSLHAPNDDIRKSLIPWAEYATIEELVDACQEYFRTSGREITFEYLLIREVNDRPEHARELAHVASQLRANVNLIRYNEVAGLPFERPATDHVLRFQRILREHRINTHIRASRGRDIAAACGQLRHESNVGVRTTSHS